MIVDLLLTNGKNSHSIAIREGRIHSLGETPSARRVIDLKGGVVRPGFIDAHVHLLHHGRLKLELDLTGVRTQDELTRRVEAYAKTRPAGTWIYGSGYELDEPPRVGVPDHPVWIVRKDGHSGVANARAMERVDFASIPEGGSVDRERGVFYENATVMVDRLVPHPSDEEALRLAEEEAFRFGITGVHDAAVDDAYLRLLPKLRVRMHAMYWHEKPDRVIDFLRSQPPRPGLRAIKLFMDGSLGSATAWMIDPPHGFPILKAPDVIRIAKVALETGYQVCTHAIGDRANREVLDAYEEANPQGDHRWRIEHAQHVHPDDLPRFGRWIASIQPSHRVADQRMIEERLADRRDRAYPWHGFSRIALGTDAPVETIDPRWTYRCAVERLTPERTLRGMTVDAAYAGFSDAGVLEPGRPADLAVWPEDWLSSEALLTIVGGQVVHERSFS